VTVVKPGKRRVPVITDVARAAGVSVPTVSRVLNGTLPVSDHKRALVLRAVHELGYRPNGAARALVTGRRSMITVIAGNTTRYGYTMTIHGIEEAARAAGYLVGITVIDSGAAQQPVAAAVDLVLGQPVAGVIVLDFDEQGGRAVTAMPDTVPLAVVSSRTLPPGIPRVLFDDRRGGYEATYHLLGLGHRTVHHVAMPESGRPNGRLLGWRSALQDAGAAVPEVLDTDWTVGSGYRAGRALAAMPDVSAVFCGNDEIAFAVLKALQDAGRDIPGDVSVVGFDDHPHAALWSPPLTTVGQDFAELGRAAVALLLAVIDESPPPTPAASAGVHLVVRDSTAPPRR
jgi:DNA-binding LacI/PurR family transcriptional regulator